MSHIARIFGGIHAHGKVVNAVAHYYVELYTPLHKCLHILLIANLIISCSPGTVNVLGAQKSDSPNSLQAEAVKV